MAEHPVFEAVKKMPEPWRSHFPKSTEEAQEWQAIIDRRSPGRNVLCVARTRIEGKWGAYCAAVSGIECASDTEAVLNHGQKLPEPVARAIFPRFKDVPYAG